MDTRHLDYDPLTKTHDIVHLDGTGKAVIESIQDCEDIIEMNAYDAEFFDKKADYWKIGTIPLSHCFEWARETGTRPFTRAWQAAIKRYLHDPDFQKFNVNRIKF